MVISNLESRKILETLFEESNFQIFSFPNCICFDRECSYFKLLQPCLNEKGGLFGKDPTYDENGELFFSDNIYDYFSIDDFKMWGTEKNQNNINFNNVCNLTVLIPLSTPKKLIKKIYMKLYENDYENGCDNFYIHSFLDIIAPFMDELKWFAATFGNDDDYLLFVTSNEYKYLVDKFISKLSQKDLENVAQVITEDGEYKWKGHDWWKNTIGMYDLLRK